MKTDKELLMLAAKAAGVVGDWVTGYEGDFYYQGNSEGIIYELNQGGLVVWNPLSEDGDALRLAVDLGMCVDVSYGFDCTTVDYSECGDKTLCEAHGNDKQAATRRAVVRAAAAIGEAM